jgi:hypothetical protein
MILVFWPVVNKVILKMRKNSTEVTCGRPKKIPGKVVQWGLKIPVFILRRLRETADDEGITAASLARRILSQALGIDYQEYE